QHSPSGKPAPSRAGFSLFWAAEDTVEDRVDVLRVIGEIEHSIEIGWAYLCGDVLVGLEFGEEVLALLPGFHGVALDKRVGVFSAQPGLRQSKKHALRIMETCELIEVPSHVLRIDDELLDDAGKPVQRKLEGHRRIRADHPLDA